eukprot:g3818.t1
MRAWLFGLVLAVWPADANTAPPPILGGSSDDEDGAKEAVLKKLSLEPSKHCTLVGGTFYPDGTFYVVECEYDATYVTFDFGAPPPSTVYLDEWMRPLSDGQYSVDLPEPGEPRPTKVYACAAGAGPATAGGLKTFQSLFASEKPRLTARQRAVCTQYTFSALRLPPSEGAVLEDLAVNLRHDAAMIAPAFTPSLKKYEAFILTGEDFTVVAAAQNPEASVGLQFPRHLEARSKYVSECAAGPDSVARWTFPPYHQPTASDGDLFRVCLFSGSGLPVVYEIRLHVEQKLDLHLTQLSVEGRELVPKFDPKIREYTVMVDKKSSGAVITASGLPDTRVRIRDQRGHETTEEKANKFRLQLMAIYSTSLGTTSKKLQRGSPAEEAVEISVLPEAGGVASKSLEREYNYLVTVKRKVSNYAALTMLSVADTPCTLKPEFQPNVTDYECVWWWEYSKYAYFEADIDYEGPCHGCTINVPNPKANWHGATQLNWPARKVHKMMWGRKTIWTKYFLYGEFHTVPILVASEDQVTSKEYRVMFYRQCPWWMKASITRGVSKTATTVAVIMSIASAGNLMALAIKERINPFALVQQIQFMDLVLGFLQFLW